MPHTTFEPDPALPAPPLTTPPDKNQRLIDILVARINDDIIFIERDDRAINNIHGWKITTLP